MSAEPAVRDATLRAIAHPARRRILRLVWDQERTSTDLAGHVGLSKPATSQHLRVLRDADLVSVRIDANRRWYRAEQQRLAEVRALIEAFWGDRLDALRAAAQNQEPADG